jgi:hypothetical protein
MLWVLLRCSKDNQGVYLQPVPSKTPPWPEARRSVAPLPFHLPDPSPSVTPEVAAALIAVAAGREVPQLPGEDVAAAAAGGEDVAAAAGGVAGEEDVTEATNKPTAAGRMLHPGAAAASSSATAAAAAGTTVVQSDASGGAGGAASSSSNNNTSAGCSFCRCLVCALVYPLLLLVSLVGCVVWLVLLPFKVCCCCCCPVAMLAQMLWDVVEWGVKAPLRGALWAAGKEWRPVPVATVAAAVAGPDGVIAGRQQGAAGTKVQGDIEAPG